MIKIVRYLDVVREILEKSMLIGELTRRDLLRILEKTNGRQSQLSYYDDYVSFLLSLRLMDEFYINEENIYIITEKGRKLITEYNEVDFAISIPQYLSHLKILLNYERIYINENDLDLNKDISLKETKLFFNSELENTNFKWYRHWDYNLSFCSSYNLGRTINKRVIEQKLNSITEINPTIEFNYEYISPFYWVDENTEQLLIFLLISLVIGGFKCQSLNINKLISYFNNLKLFENSENILMQIVRVLHVLGIEIEQDEGELYLKNPIRFFICSEKLNNNRLIESIDFNNWEEFSENFFNYFFNFYSGEIPEMKNNQIFKYSTDISEKYRFDVDTHDYSIENLSRILPNNPVYLNSQSYNYKDMNILNIFYYLLDKFNEHNDLIEFFRDKLDMAKENEILLRNFCTSSIVMGKIPLFDLKQNYWEGNHYKKTHFYYFMLHSESTQNHNASIIGLFFYFQPIFRILINLLILKNKEARLDIKVINDSYYVILNDNRPILLMDIIDQILVMMNFKLWNESYSSDIECRKNLSKLLIDLCEKLNIVVSVSNLRFTVFFNKLCAYDLLKIRNNDAGFRYWLINKIQR